MAIDAEKYKALSEELKDKATLVAVSKTKPAEDIQALYNLGHRDFGENYVQELAAKEKLLPQDIRWHFIGHLQSNKVKDIAPFVYLIHGVDSLSLLKEIDKQAAKNNRIIDCLLQVHIASEETKFGLDKDELEKVNINDYENARVRGLMGMASFTNDQLLVQNEFKKLRKLSDSLFFKMDKTIQQPILSMGMSGDYKIAMEEGSNLVRIGSLLFGERNVSQS